MNLLFSFIIFCFAIYVYIKTLKKLNSIKTDVLTEDIKKEINSLIILFNNTADKKIMLLEEKKNEIEAILEKANKKILQLDEKLKREEKPFIIHKVIEKKRSDLTTENQPKKKKIIEIEENEDIKKLLDYKEDKEKLKLNNEENREIEKTQIEELKPEKDFKNNESQIDPAEKLKKLILEGKTKDELYKMGYSLNEINLMEFIIKSNTSNTSKRE